MEPGCRRCGHRHVDHIWRPVRVGGGPDTYEVYRCNGDGRQCACTVYEE